MKFIFSICSFILFMLLASSCSGQIMKTLDEAQTLKDSSQKFIGKPLKYLLKEIKPEIKMAIADPSSSNQTRLGVIMLMFVDPKDYYQLRNKGKSPLRIVIRVKEYFDWNRQYLPIEERQKWSKEDAERLGDFTILAMRVSGEK